MDVKVNFRLNQLIFCLEFDFINKICILHMTWGSLVDIIYLKKRPTSFMTYGCLLACLSLMLTKGQQPVTRAPLETSQFWYFSCSLSSILVSSSIRLSIWMCASCEFNVLLFLCQQNFEQDIATDEFVCSATPSSSHSLVCDSTCYVTRLSKPPKHLPWSVLSRTTIAFYISEACKQGNLIYALLFLANLPFHVWKM